MDTISDSSNSGITRDQPAVDAQGKELPNYENALTPATFCAKTGASPESRLAPQSGSQSVRPESAGQFR